MISVEKAIAQVKHVEYECENAEAA